MEVKRRIGRLYEADLDKRLSTNFTLGEFLRSNTAERRGELRSLQFNPPEGVLGNLQYLVDQLLQPLREIFEVPIHVNSGYRSERLNKVVHGSRNSAHIRGSAADIRLNDLFLDTPRFADMRSYILAGAGDKDRTYNANWFLWSYLSNNIGSLPVDQVIHEFGEPGHPAWVHVTCTPGRARGMVLAVGAWTENRYIKLDRVDAMYVGVR